jgi:hypothetical protein
MPKRDVPTDLSDYLSKLERRVKNLEFLVTSRVLPDKYRWEESGGSLYIRNIDTGVLSGPIA